MRAMILAGGDAARLRPLTTYTPNPVVPIANRPLLRYQIELLKRAGFREVTLVLGFHSNRIEDLIGDGREEKISIRYDLQSTTQGTAGAFRSAMGASNDPAIILYGDVLTDIQLDKLISFHRQKQSLMTMAMVAVENPSSYGMIEADENGRVLRFIEKPKLTELTYNTINAGVCVIEPRVLAMIPPKEKYSFEEQLIPRLIEAGEPVYAFSWSGYWRHIGSVKSYLSANLEVLAGRLRGFARMKSATAGAMGSAPTGVDSTSEIDSSCTIKPGAEVINSVIGPNCFIEERARIENTVLMAGVRVGRAAEIRDSVIGRSSIIGRGAKVDGAVFGDKSSLADHSVSRLS